MLDAVLKFARPPALVAVAVALALTIGCDKGIYIDDIPDDSRIVDLSVDEVTTVSLEPCTLHDPTGDDVPKDLNCVYGCGLDSGYGCVFLWPASEDESRRWGNLLPRGLKTQYTCAQYRVPTEGKVVATLGHCYFMR